MVDRNKRLVAIGLATLALLHLIAAVAQSRLPITPFDNKKFSEVVERVKQWGVKPGETIYLRLDSVAAPESLHARNPDTYSRGREAGNVWANRTTSGELTVIVVRVDMGHAGSLGYGYSESPPYEANGQYSLAEDAEHSLSCTDRDHRVGEKWWAVWSCEMD